MNKKRLGLLAIGVAALIVGSVAILAGSVYDRLSPILYVGRGVSQTNQLIFDNGHGGSNAAISADSSGDISITPTPAQIIRATTPLWSIDGTQSFPTYSFTSSTNSGIYNAGAGEVGITVGGGEVAAFNNSPGTNVIVIDGETIQAGGLSINGGGLDVTGATTLQGGGNAGSQGFKVALFSGTLLGGASATLSPSGATKIFGAFGISQCRACGGGFVTMVNFNLQSSSSGAPVTFDPSGGSATSIMVTGRDSTSENNTYTVVVIYQ